MKQIIIEDGLSIYNKTGIGRYALLLKDVLSDLGYEVLMKRKPFLEKIKNATIKRILYNIWLNSIFIIKLFFSKSKIVFFPNTMTPIVKLPNKKYYPILHDLWFYKFSDTMPKTKYRYQKFIADTIRNTAYKIITVSNTVKKEIIEYYGCKPDFVEVVSSYFSFGENPVITLDENAQLGILKEFGIEANNYILTVGSLNKRKNIKMLIKAYMNADINEKLVIVGQPDNETFEETAEKVIFTGYTDEETLKVLYKNAKIYVFPSIYEGMGLPTIDAQSFGIPVLCSDIPVFHEIGSDSVVYFELNTEGLQNSLQFITNNTLMQQQLIAKGYENIKRFSINNIKEQLSSAIKE